MLFVAEAPPADLARFFYFEDVKTHDGLFLAMMRALHQDASEATASELRQQKREYLRRFKSDGYYLIEAVDHPMPKRATAGTKGGLIRASIDALIQKARRACKDDTRVVCIGESVHRICAPALRAAGFNVINTETIPLPSSGHQRSFQKKLRPLLDELLQEAIRGLEQSIRFFGPGEANQKTRERWVVETFLRGIGIGFRDPTEIEQPEDDPPDARFRGAAFEVKEVQDRGRRRGDEYKEHLRKARNAESSDELVETFTPNDIAVGQVYLRLLEETAALAANKYRSEEIRRGLDLLFYLNLGMERAWGIIDGARPDLRQLRVEGWRSVSFVQGGDGSATCCVLVASEDAPPFLREIEGQIVRPG